MKRTQSLAIVRRAPAALQRLTLSLLLFLMIYPLAAQQTANLQVKGQVTDENAQPLSGVSIYLKGDQTNGTTTNENGEYAISLTNSKTTLVFSFVGYANKEMAVNGTATLNVALQKDQTNLGEVVVVGYGTQKKVNLTGSVATISSKNLASRQVGQASAALQGLAPGVTVVQSTGRPGADGGTIRIRGIGTLNDSDPMVLIDGIEGSLNNIDPNLIESISILKDAASSSIYGSRAANGVILVTTKRGKGTRINVNYSGYVGWQKPTNLPDIVNAVDHMEMLNVAYKNVGLAPLFSDALLNDYRTKGASDPDNYPDVDWQKELLTGSGLVNSHFISVAGGSEKIKFLTSFGYFKQEGIIESSSFKRFTLRNNLDIKISNKLSLKADIQVVTRTTKEPGRGNELIFYYMNRMPAIQPGVFTNGNYGEGWNGNNPIAIARPERGLRKNNAQNATANVFLTWKPLKELQVELNASPRYNESNDNVFVRTVRTYKADGTIAYAAVPAQSSLNVTESSSFYNNFRGIITYTKEMGDHSLKALVGASREDMRNESVSAARTGFTLPEYPVLGAGASDQQTNTGGVVDWALQSFFGRINYDYKQRYLLELNARYDGSSRFAKGHKYGFFPSFSAGWRISEEAFMQPLREVVTELKLRGSWGRLGNQNIGNYPFTSSIVQGSYSMGGAIVNTAALNTLANSDIRWETTEMTNFGIDATLLKNFTVVADVYSRTTRDILYDLDIPLTMGLAAPPQNAGVVRNRGWELGLTYRNNVRAFQYDVNFNISDVINRVIDLKGVNRSGLTVSREGYPINAIYGYESIGFFQTDEEAAKYATQFGVTKAGDLKYKDQNDDGQINDADLRIIGSTIPRFTYSANLNASYKGFGLNIFFQGVGKADGYMYEQGIMPFFNGGTVQEQHKNYWRPDNTNAAFPRLAFGQSNNEKNSSFWMKDAAYLRLKTLQLSYTLPAAWMSNLKISNMRLYVSGQNLLTWDNFWKGYDVESPVNTGTVYPQVKMYTVGLDVNF
ncbi:TonB-dependent receptor [Paraflavitalea sp. CAU 1676]|uniref:SusC/RagA family TonB-linked outer membrane protein n=1 Tax=Paraflavitalea sp. CAU 1676 TaxID=3032598 RepID=UPI0023DC379F|nr:TonB-dependent receptor [Paraflavitalea sp. CAU 1676]MDF2191144.1 TonB-dependent receptor [Paraflavitalea sp. CAU 1676]